MLEGDLEALLIRAMQREDAPEVVDMLKTDRPGDLLLKTVPVDIVGGLSSEVQIASRASAAF
jgi:hypothetical protein